MINTMDGMKTIVRIMIIQSFEKSVLGQWAVFLQELAGAEYKIWRVM
jgi:hypothetical protein